MILVSEERKRVFFLTEKCASTSIRDALLNSKTAKWVRIQSTFPKDYTVPDGFSSYAVIRNPYPRLLSYYRFRRMINGERRTFAKFILDGIDLMPLVEYLDVHCKSIEFNALTFDCLLRDWRLLGFDLDEPNPRWMNATGGDTWQNIYNGMEQEGIVDAVYDWAEEDFSRWYPRIHDENS